MNLKNIFLKDKMDTISDIEQKYKFLLTLKLKNDQLLLDPSKLEESEILLDLIYYCQNYRGKNLKEELTQACELYEDGSSFIFSLSMFNDQQQNYESERERMMTGIQRSKSQMKCIKCGQQTVEYYEKQTRSGDEGMTVLFSCLSCGAKWKI